MVLDVEGHELSALEGMADCKVLPTVMCVEHGHSGFDDIRTLLSAMGYTFDILSFANAFYVKTDRLRFMRSQWQ